MVTGALFDRAWWSVALVLVALHASDIPMYDSRINVAGWVVLAGLRAFLRGQAPAPDAAPDAAVKAKASAASEAVG
jgi:hypothetical protein